MNPSIRYLLALLVPFGGFGLFLLAVADDSFLFLPIGSDLLTVVLVARNHNQFLLCVLAAAAGSTLGVYLLDLVCRNGGEAGLKKLVKPAQLQRLKQRMQHHTAAALIVACLAPPPFPFGVYLATASAFQYPRARLLGLVFAARTLRFTLVAWSAVYFGRHIIRIADSNGFLWFMGIFIAVCLIGSVISIGQLLRIARSR